MTLLRALHLALLVAGCMGAPDTLPDAPTDDAGSDSAQDALPDAPAAFGCAPRTPAMSLPASRNTTYAPNSQVKSADLNDIQDKIIDLNAALSAQQFALPLTAPAISTGLIWDESALQLKATSFGSLLTQYIPVGLLPAGTVVTNLQVIAAYDSTSLGTITARLGRLEEGAFNAALGSSDLTLSTPPSDTNYHSYLQAQTAPISVGVRYVVRLQISADFDGSFVCVDHIGLTVDLPST